MGEKKEAHVYIGGHYKNPTTSIVIYFVSKTRLIYCPIYTKYMFRKLSYKIVIFLRLFFLQLIYNIKIKKTEKKVE